MLATPATVHRFVDRLALDALAGHGLEAGGHPVLSLGLVDDHQQVRTLVLDTDGKIFELYAEAEAGVTRNVIIDKDGKVAFLTRLFDREEFDAMKSKINELLETK